MNLKVVLLIICTISGSGCFSQETDLQMMDKIDKEFQKRQQEVLIAYMSPKVMFPDPQVRALAKAASKGDLVKVDRLVVEGVNVNARGTSDVTPLFLAMQNARGFEHLLKLGAHPNVLYGEKGKNGTIMHFAVWHKNPRILELALLYGGDPNLPEGQTMRTPIFEAMGPDNKDKISTLIEAGADVNAQLFNGDTPMITAAGLGQFDTVYDLLLHGADYGLKNRFTDKTLADMIAFRRRTMDPKLDNYYWMGKVIDWLGQRGVEIPDWHDPA